MKASIEVTLEGFAVPDYVKGIIQGPSGSMLQTESFIISSIDADTLEMLCGQFRAEVFKKAGKNPPPTVKKE